MLAEIYLKKREKKGREEERERWRQWYEANKDHINGASPPPEKLES